MGWCHYQGSDGNCTHSDLEGQDRCPGSIKNHLLKIRRGQVANDDGMKMRSVLLDDLGIKSSGTSEDKKLRQFLLEVEDVEKKVNINKGAPVKMPAEYAIIMVSVFKHDIKVCRCHMLEKDIIPGHQAGTLTYREGFRIYSQAYIKNHVEESLRPAPKQNPASLTPLAQSLLQQTDSQLGVIESLQKQLSELTLILKNKDAERVQMEMQAARQMVELEKQKEEQLKRLAEHHKHELEFVKQKMLQCASQAQLYKAMAGEALDREKNIDQTYQDMRSAFLSLENEYEKLGQSIPYDQDTLKKICIESQVFHTVYFFLQCFQECLLYSSSIYVTSVSVSLTLL